jgi:Ca2+-binding RTX toxin-like protein
MSNILTEQVFNTIPERIEKSELYVGFQEVAQIPESGNENNQSARLNLLVDPGDGSGRLFVNDMRGKLYVIADGIASEYMDLENLVGEGFQDQTGQQGFSYFAFHPEFATNGIFYTINSEDKKTGTPDFPVTKPIIDNNGNIIESSHHSVVREWNVINPSANTFSGTVREMLRIEQPYEDHNLGQLAFNPNANLGDADYGMLYIAVADGGSDGFPVSDTDPLDNGQDLSTILGSIMRIEPFGNNSANGQYGIPNDNPFVDDEDPNTLGEIWAYGFRNPHRFSWDTGGEGKMLIVDIGQAFIEEVNLGIRGANYGWGEREGTWVIDENNENVLFPLPENDEDFGFTYPVAQYNHDIPPDVSDFFGIAIAGGFVYRGEAIPELVGHYVFADFGNDGRFFHVPVDDLRNGRQAKIQELRLFDGNEEASFLDIIGKPRSDVRFGMDEEGEIYVTSKQDGKVRKIIRVDVITGGGGNDTIEGLGNNDTINGNAGNDSLIGGEGRDSLVGAAGNDTLDGGTGVDQMRGSDGDDTYIVDEVDDRIRQEKGNEAGGIDTVESSISYTIPRNVENLTLTGRSRIDAIGDNSDNTLTGNRGQNVLEGFDGDDFLSGEGAEDRLRGGSGNDILIGGSDNDILAGGSGNDLFLFNNPSEGVDDINDFGDGDDIIGISADGFGGGLTVGTLPDNQFIVGTGAETAEHRFIFDNGNLFFDVDGTGDEGQIQIATISSTITAGDILIQ